MNFHLSEFPINPFLHGKQINDAPARKNFMNRGLNQECENSGLKRANKDFTAGNAL